MKKITGWRLLAIIVAVMVLACVIVQIYLQDNLVVSAEHHEHAHTEEEPAAETPLKNTETFSDNLISNFSFEVGTDLAIDGWSPSGEDPGTSAWRDTSIYAFGSASATVDSGSGSRGVDLLWTQQLADVPAGKDVTIKGYVKTENLHGNAFLRITGSEKTTQETYVKIWYNLDSPGGTSDWTAIEGKVYLPAEVNFVEVSAGLYGEGRAWFDEISLLSSDPSLAPLQRDANLLINPDFSQDLAGWYFFSPPGAPGIDWGVAAGGSGHGDSLFLTQPHVVDTGYYSGFYQTVNDLYRTGDNAVLTGWAKTSGLDGTVWINLNFYCASAKYVYDSPLTLSGTQDWQQFSVNAKVPENADSVWVRLIISGRGTAFFDDLDFRLVPSDS